MKPQFSVTEAMLMYKNGCSQQQIADHFGMTQSGIAYHFRRHDEWSQVARNKWTPDRASIAVELYQSGMNLSQTSRALKASKRNIRKALQEAQISIRSQSESQSGKNNWAWNGGVTILKGYTMIHKPDHPYATKHGYVAEHRLVVESRIGRLLTPGEVVHHIDGNKSNNHPDNLQLFESNGEHLKVDLKGRTPKWSEDGKERIRQAVSRPRSEETRQRCRIAASQRELKRKHNLNHSKTDDPA
jgi:hypothetical protein